MIVREGLPSQDFCIQYIVFASAKNRYILYLFSYEIDILTQLQKRYRQDAQI